MRIESFSYNDHSWKLDNLNLQELNLLVGRNASGKSRTLSAIDLLVDIISQKRELTGGGSWKLRFRTSIGEALDYSVATKSSGQITREVLVLNGKHLLDRKSSESKVFSRITDQFEEFFPPENQLVLHVRRDIRAFPEFERLIEWATNSYGFRFGTISPLNALANSGYDFINPVDDLMSMFRYLSPERKAVLLSTLNQLGYNVTSIKPIEKYNNRFLEVVEDGLSKPIPHTGLSQGMFRVIALLTYFSYLIHVKKPQLLIIDDLGEGLDYSRAVKLGKFIFDACRDETIQLIATSNDNFLMDAIPIEHWNVLRRNGTEITALNEKNSPELFNNFSFTGLSNFDFFSSDYIDSNL